MDELINSCWRHFISFRDRDFITEKSIPILYFGDINKYNEGKSMRVITVALNPSNNEFPEDNSFTRFKGARYIHQFDTLDDMGKRIYKETLNNYFEDNPYYRWFINLEPLLNGLNASYREKGLWKENAPLYGLLHREQGYKYRAVHTDICTPLSTNPVWSKLDEAVREDLFPEGINLYKELENSLAPTVIAISVAKNNLPLLEITDDMLVKQYHFYNENGDIKDVIRVYRLNRYSSEGTIVIQGKNVKGTPFGCLTQMERYEVGRKIYREFIGTAEDG